MLKSARSSSMSLSAPPPEANARGFRASMSAACPTRISAFGDHPHTVLTTIPLTPSIAEVNSSHGDGLMSPFKQNADYFAFDLGNKSDKEHKQTSAGDDLMQL
jgi:hypothetical protein